MKGSFFPAALVALLLGGAAAASQAAAVTEALARPAVQVRQPAAAALLAAAWAGPRIVAVGERGIVALSDDRGAHWRQVPSPVSVTLTAVHFADASHGVAVGHGGAVLYSSDGGASWALRSDGRRLAQTVRAAARAAGDERLLRDAERLVADGPDKPLLDLLMFDARRLLAVGAYGLAVYSEDAGQSWTDWSTRLDNPSGLHLYALRRRGEQLLVAGEQGLLRLSTDGGRSFRSLASPYRGSFFSAEMPAAAELLVAGLRGNVWHSVDAGQSWRQIEVPMPASITSSALAPDGSLRLANQAGFVLRLQADRLRPVHREPLPLPAGLLPLPDGRTLVLGLSGARILEELPR